MAKKFTRILKHQVGTQFEAVCTNCNYNGPYRQTKGEALQDAAGHNAQPGNANHIVKIITIDTNVENFVQPKSK